MVVDRDAVRRFFEKRFKRKAVEGESYFEEWVERFGTGVPYAYMDSESLKVYLDMIGKNHGVSIKLGKVL